MKLLWITPSFQHPNVRGSARHYNFVRELSGRHEITLLTLGRSPITLDAQADVAEHTSRLIVIPTAEDPSQSRLERAVRLRLAVRKLRQAFLREVGQSEYDVVIFHGKPVFKVLSGWRRLPIVADFCDATSFRIQGEMAKAGRSEWPLLAFRYARTRRVERELIGAADQLAFITPRDREAVLGQQSDALVIPNGVQLNFWRRTAPRTTAPRLVFAGVMDYEPNNDAALYLIGEIFPKIRDAIPNAELQIVGRRPTEALMERARGMPGVLITGEVDDVRPYLENAAVCVVPLRFASGMQNKLLEAMAMAVPVVTTPVAAEGLRVDGGATPPLIVASGADEFAARTVELLSNPGDQTQLGDASREFVEEHFDWSRSAQMLEGMCKRAQTQ